MTKINITTCEPVISLFRSRLSIREQTKTAVSEKQVRERESGSEGSGKTPLIFSLLARRLSHRLTEGLEQAKPLYGQGQQNGGGGRQGGLGGCVANPQFQEKMK